MLAAPQRWTHQAIYRQCQHACSRILLSNAAAGPVGDVVAPHGLRGSPFYDPSGAATLQASLPSRGTEI